jgi:hypothetical protein
MVGQLAVWVLWCILVGMEAQERSERGIVGYTLACLVHEPGCTDIEVIIVFVGPGHSVNPFKI